MIFNDIIVQPMCLVPGPILHSFEKASLTFVPTSWRKLDDRISGFSGYNKYI